MAGDEPGSEEHGESGVDPDTSEPPASHAAARDEVHDEHEARGTGGRPGGSGDRGGHNPRSRGLDTVIGAAARAVRATGTVVSGGERVASALIESPMGRVASGAARRITDPLAQEGAEVREQLGEDVPELARGMSSRLVPAVVETLDPELLLDSIDIEQLLDHIDVNAIISKVDINAILTNVDIDGLLERIDMDALLERIDVNKIVGSVDMDSILQRTEIGGLIAKSTSGMAAGAVDVLRRQGVGLDNFVARWFDRVFRRRRPAAPHGPPLLVNAALGELQSGAA